MSLSFKWCLSLISPRSRQWDKNISGSGFFGRRFLELPRTTQRRETRKGGIQRGRVSKLVTTVGDQEQSCSETWDGVDRTLGYPKWSAGMLEYLSTLLLKYWLRAALRWKLLGCSCGSCRFQWPETDLRQRVAELVVQSRPASRWGKDGYQRSWQDTDNSCLSWQLSQDWFPLFRRLWLRAYNPLSY